MIYDTNIDDFMKGCQANYETTDNIRVSQIFVFLQSQKTAKSVYLS